MGSWTHKLQLKCLKIPLNLKSMHENFVKSIHSRKKQFTRIKWGEPNKSVRFKVIPWPKLFAKIFSQDVKRKNLLVLMKNIFKTMLLIHRVWIKVRNRQTAHTFTNNRKFQILFHKKAKLNQIRNVRLKKPKKLKKLIKLKNYLTNS